jgi:hypothetical protein
MNMGRNFIVPVDKLLYCRDVIHPSIFWANISENGDLVLRVGMRGTNMPLSSSYLSQFLTRSRELAAVLE